ncbi:MAG: hydroxyacylglutathione hydrolase family protein [Thermoplasmata archaeon]
MIFEQVRKQGDNFSYLIGDEGSGLAAVVDPSGYQKEILRIMADKRLKLRYVFLTHSHPDHTSGTEHLVRKTGAKVIAHETSRVKKDIGVNDSQKIKMGNLEFKIIHTPGHTSDGICVIVDNRMMTGDTLFVRECGRTDLADGDTVKMYGSLNRLKALPEEMEVWPGHDYGPKPSSTIGEEKRENYTLEDRTLDEFIEFMKEP